MKTVFSFCLFTFSILLFSSPIVAQKASKGCIEVTRFYVLLDPPVAGFDFLLGAVEISYSVGGEAEKSFEVIINGHRSVFRAVGTATLVLDLLLAKGESLTVTLNIYSSANPGKGKLCFSETRFIEAVEVD